MSTWVCLQFSRTRTTGSLQSCRQSLELVPQPWRGVESTVYSQVGNAPYDWPGHAFETSRQLPHCASIDRRLECRILDIAIQREWARSATFDHDCRTAWIAKRPTPRQNQFVGPVCALAFREGRGPTLISILASSSLCIVTQNSTATRKAAVGTWIAFQTGQATYCNLEARTPMSLRPDKEIVHTRSTVEGAGVKLERALGFSARRLSLIRSCCSTEQNATVGKRRHRVTADPRN